LLQVGAERISETGTDACRPPSKGLAMKNGQQIKNTICEIELLERLCDAMAETKTLRIGCDKGGDFWIQDNVRAQFVAQLSFTTGKAISELKTQYKTLVRESLDQE
jgi:hypothetical protein